MTAYSLSDEKLLATDFFTDDPSAIEGLILKPPAKDAVLRVVLEYELARDQPEVRCSLCKQKQGHRKGFVVQTPEDAKHLIGSSCGPRHLGLSFGTARSAFQAERERQTALKRMGRTRSLLQKQPDHDLKADEALPLLAAEESLRSGCSALYRRLRELALTGAGFSKEVRQRDIVKEQASRSNEELWVTNLESIGPFEGRGLVHARKHHKTLHEWPRVVATYLRQTDHLGLPTDEIKRASKRLQDANAMTRDAVVCLKQAHRFFEPDNLAKIAAWEPDQRKGAIVITKGGKFIARCYQSETKGIIPPEAFVMEPIQLS